MGDEDRQAILTLLRALADETRLRILGILATKEHSVDELASLLQLKAPTVSHHLAKLKETGLVSMAAQGNTHIYRFEPEALRQSNKALLTPEKVAACADDVPTDAWERKVFHDFMEGERIKQLPVSTKKRLVLLKWLAGRFETGRRYREAEVNEVIKGHHPDFATLRREMVDYHFMARENGIYWLAERVFVGCVILESLDDPAVLTGWQPFAQREADVPEDPDATVWHTAWYQVREDELRQRLPALARAMRPHWYAHFWEGDDLCMVLAGKSFWAKVSDRSTWDEFIAYGDTVGVERKWTERVPTEVPDWAKTGGR